MASQIQTKEFIGNVGEEKKENGPILLRLPNTIRLIASDAGNDQNFDILRLENLPVGFLNYRLERD